MRRWVLVFGLVVSACGLPGGFGQPALSLQPGDLPAAFSRCAVQTDLMSYNSDVDGLHGSASNLTAARIKLQAAGARSGSVDAWASPSSACGFFEANQLAAGPRLPADQVLVIIVTALFDSQAAAAGANAKQAFGFVDPARTQGASAVSALGPDAYRSVVPSLYGVTWNRGPRDLAITGQHLGAADGDRAAFRLDSRVPHS
jgi:hypothetical protein